MAASSGVVNHRMASKKGVAKLAPRWLLLEGF
jgi:hypothetical protein